MGVLEAARCQEIDHDFRSTDAHQSIVVAEACDRLGLSDRSFKKWRSNFIADLYISRTENLLLKVVVGKPAETVQTQFATLVETRRVGESCSYFRAPLPILDLSELSAYVMELAEGRPLPESLSASRTEERLLAASWRCGAGLAALHAAWYRDSGNIRIDEILEDFESNCPWELDAVVRQMLRRLGDELRGVRVRFSRQYRDFDPVNVLISDGLPTFIDPPEVDDTGPIQWDIGVFTLGLKRSWWPRPWLLPRASATVSAFESAFLSGYEEASGQQLARADRLTLWTFESLRLAQLALWWGHPQRLRHPLKGRLRAAYVKPLVGRTWKHQIDVLKQLLVTQD